MIARDLIINSFRLLRNKKRRLLTSLLGAIFAISLIVSLVILFANMNGALERQRMEEYGSLDLMVGFQGNSINKQLSADQIEMIKNVSGVEATGSAIVNIGLYYPDQRPEILSKVYTAIDNSNMTLSSYKIDSPLKPNEVIISSSLAEFLNKKVNDLVELPLPQQEESRQLKIVQITEENVLRDSVYISMELFHLLYGDEVIASPLLVGLEPKVDHRKISMQLRGLISPDLYISSVDAYEEEKNNIQSLKLMSYTFASMAIIAAAMFVLSNSLLSIRERFRDLALLRMIGASPIQLFIMVWVEAFFIGATASALGLILGIGVSSLLYEFVNQWVGIHSYGFEIPWVVCIIAVLISWFFLVVISAYPALKAARILPMALVRESYSVVHKIKRTRSIIAMVLGVAGLLFLTIGLFLETDSGSGFRPLMILLGGIFVSLGLFIVIPYSVKPILQFFQPLVLKSVGRHGLVAVKNLVAESKQSALTITVLALAPVLFFSTSIFLSSLQSSMVGHLYKTYVTDIRVAHSLGPGSNMHLDKTAEILSLQDIEWVIPTSFVEVAALKEFAFEMSDPKWREENKELDNSHGIPKRELFGYKLVDLQGLIELGQLPAAFGDLDNQVYMTYEYAEKLGVKTGDTIKVIRNGVSSDVTIGS